MNPFKKATIIATLTLLAAFALPALAEKPHNWQTATVIAQDFSTQAAGAYAAPIGTGIIGMPLYRRTNYVVVETALYRFQWSEIGRNTVILPVHGQVQFYQDGNYFVVLDSKNHKHKFALVGATVKQSVSIDWNNLNVGSNGLNYALPSQQSPSAAAGAQ